MTAGEGTIHSEMPAQKNGLMRGFQLWVSLPSDEKYTKSKYSDIKRKKIPIIKEGNTSTKVIAGCYKNIKGPVDSGKTRLDFFDIKQTKGVQTLNLDKDKKHLIYMFESELKTAGMIFRERQGAKLYARIIIKCKKLTQFLLISGIPLREPIVKCGPFVLNMKIEICEAIQKYKNGLFGT